MTTEYSASRVTIKPFSEAAISAHFDVKYLYDLREARAMTEMRRGHSTQNPSRAIARERGGRSGSGGFREDGRGHDDAVARFDIDRRAIRKSEVIVDADAEHVRRQAVAQARQNERLA